MPTLTVSTDSVFSQNPIDFWRTTLAAHMMHCHVEPIEPGPFYGRLTIRRLQQLTIISGVEAGVRHWRQQELLDDNNDDFVLVISGNGGTTLSQRDRELALGAGEATLWSAAEAGWLSRATIDRFMALRVSRAAIVNLFSEADLAIMRRIPRSSPTLQLLTRYLDRMLNSDTLPLAAPLLTRHIIELIGAAIKTAEQQHGVREGTAQAARLDAIRADILQDLSKVQLSAKTIARKHGITARYVHLLFRQTGQTFGQFLEEARLRRAMALLNDPTHAKLRVGDIASLVGYAEHSSFHRAFRRYFGETPGRARKLSRRHARPYAID